MVKRTAILFLLLLLALIPIQANAQNLLFNLEQETVHVFWNEDGTSSIDYVFVFNNSPSGAPIDYIDVALPNDNFDWDTIFVEVDGVEITTIEETEYVDSGFAIAMGPRTIQPGESARVHAFIGTVEDVLYPDETGDEYVSAVFSPTRFDSQFVQGDTDLTVIFHLPPGVGPDDPRWHASPPSWPSEPETALDEDGRVMYTWQNPRADASTQYTFGASFPAAIVPESAVVRENPFSWLGTFFSAECLIPLACIGFFGVIIALGFVGDRQRKLKYLPPKISIEGHGIKRGLTAIEAAILMEQPLDKVLTMILFAVIKKNAARVIRRDPLEIEVLEPLPEDLHPYEKEFLAAFQEKRAASRKKQLQEMMVSLVKSVSQKMKGFSRKESVAYYKDIMERAWAQVEAADTPEVQSEKFDEVMEWTMLDRDFDDRTRRTFHGPVIIPTWWGRYDPTFSRPASTTTARPTGGQTGGGQISMPTLPGGEFAASMVGGIQSFSSRVVGNITDFTSGITRQTNPVPKSTSRGGSYRGGGGGGCACACACAGCACACAGGGR